MFWNYRTHSVVNAAITDYTLMLCYKLTNLLNWVLNIEYLLEVLVRGASYLLTMVTSESVLG